MRTITAQIVWATCVGVRSDVTEEAFRAQLAMHGHVVDKQPDGVVVYSFSDGSCLEEHPDGTLSVRRLFDDVARENTRALMARTHERWIREICKQAMGGDKEAQEKVLNILEE